MKPDKKTLDTSRRLQSLVMEFDAEYKNLEAVSEFIQETLLRFWEFDDDLTLMAVKLSVHEACANIIEHAYGEMAGRIQLIATVDPDEGTIRFDLYDWGRPADFSTLDVLELNEGHLKGYGLYLMQQLMDSIHYSFESGTNHWCLKKRI
jgi:serine/threonine-protein kinase RsbW